MPWDILVGRSLAFCVHPVAGWGRLTASGRMLVVTAYFGASYVLILAILFIA